MVFSAMWIACDRAHAAFGQYFKRLKSIAFASICSNILRHVLSWQKRSRLFVTT